jgi:hypothetical protein
MTNLAALVVTLGGSDFKFARHNIIDGVTNSAEILKFTALSHTAGYRP